MIRTHAFQGGRQSQVCPTVMERKLKERTMPVNSENTLKNIAYELFTHIAFAEKKAISSGQTGDLPSKAWILETYAECLKAVQAPQQIGRM